jgi:hypothetical protein
MKKDARISRRWTCVCGEFFEEAQPEYVVLAAGRLGTQGKLQQGPSEYLRMVCATCQKYSSGPSKMDRALR